MLFRRRQPLTKSQKILAALRPPRSWRRSLRYMRKRVLRLRATPHAVAAGFAVGVFATFTPLLGFHFAIALALSWLIGGNLAAAAIGCLTGNPLTYPLIWASTWEVGHVLLAGSVPGGEAPEGLGSALLHGDLAAVWQPYLKPMLVGSVPLGLLFAALSYLAVFLAVRSFRNGRRAPARPGLAPVAEGNP